MLRNYFIILSLLVNLCLLVNLNSATESTKTPVSTSDVNNKSKVQSYLDNEIFYDITGKPIYRDVNGKPFISSRQNIFIKAVDYANGASGVGVRKIEVKIDDMNSPEYEYIGSVTNKFSVGYHGKHTLYFRVTDRLNNISKYFKRFLYVDDIAPIPSISLEKESQSYVYKKGDTWYLPQNGRINISAEDNDSGVKNLMINFNKDNKFNIYKKGSTITVSKKGWNVIKVKASDNVSNISSEYIYNFFVDTTPPCISLLSNYGLLSPGEDNLNGSPSNNNNINNNYIGSLYEEIGYSNISKDILILPGSEVKLDNKSNLDNSSISDTKNNDSKENLNNKDDKENLNSKGIKKLEFTNISNKLGDSNGWCSNNIPVGSYTNKFNKFFLQSYDKDSGVKSIHFKVDNEPWVLYKEPISFSKSGPQILYIKSTDNVGNSRVVMLSIIVDDIAPNTTMVAETEKDEVIGSAEKRIVNSKK